MHRYQTDTLERLERRSTATPRLDYLGIGAASQSSKSASPTGPLAKWRQEKCGHFRTLSCCGTVCGGAVSTLRLILAFLRCARRVFKSALLVYAGCVPFLLSHLSALNRIDPVDVGTACCYRGLLRDRPSDHPYVAGNSHVPP